MLPTRKKALLLFATASLFSINQSAVLVAAAIPSAESLVQRAFQDPAVPFQARLILTEWNGSSSKAEEMNVIYSPPHLFRIEFLTMDGSVQKILFRNSANGKFILANQGMEPAISLGPVAVAQFLTPSKESDLIRKNYKFELKGSDMFIGRDVWNVHLIPKNSGKPIQELKVDKQTQVVLEHRRYLKGDSKAGSLTRFSTFLPYPPLLDTTFPGSIRDQLESESKDLAQKPGEDKGVASVTPNKELAAGFTLNGYRQLDIEGTQAKQFYYTDGVLPLSVFETSRPVKMNGKNKETPSPSDFAITPYYGFASADHVLHGKKGKSYITIIGEASPDLMQSIVQSFQTQ